MKKINPEHVYFIKLGEGGRWNRECIEEENSVKISFTEFTHEELESRDWEKIREYYRQKGTVPVWVSMYANQIMNFYESSEKILWITFYQQKLWWSFAEQKVHPGKNGEKYRKVIGRWRSKDINGKELFVENLSGNLTKVQGFRSTICNVNEKDYLIKKINAEVLPEVEEVTNDIISLKRSLSKLIKKLTPGDFEVLIDLIFRNLGCRRISIIGGPQKTKDIELEAPVTGERYLVQIKSSADLKNFQHYEKKFKEMTDYDRCFFVVHTPKADLKKFDALSSEKVVLWKMDEISTFSINSGLVDWIVNKVA